MEDLDCSVSISNLICQEDVTHLDDDDDDEHHMLMHSKDSLLSETEDEYIEILVSKECSFESRSFDESSEEWLRCARSVHVRWIIRMKAWFGFGLQTAYLAVTYFDRFLLRRTIDEGKTWAFRLLSIACLSLATKMEESRPPALSEFQIEDYHFSSTMIQRMELLVLSSLEWRMSPVTPFPYLSYFASKLRCEVRTGDLLSGAIGFIFAAIEVMSSVDYRSSTVAVAAILAESNQMLTKKLVESKISIISLPESLEVEHVFSCYCVMIQESQKTKLESSKLVDSSNLSANRGSVDDSVNVIDTTPFIASRFKRRRLQLP